MKSFSIVVVRIISRHTCRYVSDRTIQQSSTVSVLNIFFLVRQSSLSTYMGLRVTNAFGFV